MSGTVFGSRIRSSVSTFAFAALMATAPVLAAGVAGAATVVPASPAATAPAATTTDSTTATTTATPAPKLEQKADGKADATKPTVKTETHSQTAPIQKQVAATPKAEVTKAQADAVAKELGTKPSESLTVQLGKYHEQLVAAHALKDGAARDKAVTEARQQLTAVAGKPVTAEQAAKIDGILGVKAAPATVQ